MSSPSPIFLMPDFFDLGIPSVEELRADRPLDWTHERDELHFQMECWCRIQHANRASALLVLQNHALTTRQQTVLAETIRLIEDAVLLTVIQAAMLRLFPSTAQLVITAATEWALKIYRFDPCASARTPIDRDPIG